MKKKYPFITSLPSKLLINVLFLLFLSSTLNAQTVLINPTGNGGFETGATFAANGWTNTSGTATRNQWVCSTGATAGFAGVRCAYVSQNRGATPPPFTYDITATRATHIYRDVSVPAGESNIALSFRWIGQGESSFDRIRVWAVPTSYAPAYGTAITSSGTAPTGNIQLGVDYNVQATWTTANITLPTAYAGATFRLVFEWTNDASGGTQPPGAVDNISLTSAAPTAPCAYSASSTSYWISNVTTTGGYSNFNNTTTLSAGGYGDYFASQFVNQSAGGTINFSMTNSSGTHGVNVWVDWNNDFDFADVGEKVYASGAYVASTTGSFTVPVAQPNGNYRMRIVSHFLNTDPPACSSETYTEAEDYRIVVSAPPTCYAPIVSANASSTTAGNATWTPPVLGTSPVGYEYVISTSSSLPGGAGTPIAGTSTSFTGLTPNTTYYVFVRSNCGSGDFSAWGSSSFYTGYCQVSSTGSSYFTNNFSTLGGSTNITNNGSGFSAGGYGNFTGQNVTQAVGGTVSFSAAISGGSAGMGIWIDWNNDLDFNDPGEDVYNSNAYVTSATGFIIVPTGASIGNHRMRVLINGVSTMPTACGSGSSIEAEDYTFIVASPPACSGVPTNLSVFVASMTSSIISWTAAVPAPASGYQYYINTTGTVPTGATAPSGSVGAGVTSATITGLTAGTKYYVWVRSNCGGTQGTWAGVLIFTQPTCAVGPGTGTTSLGCPTSVSGGLGLSGAPAPPINCSTSACANLEATFTPIKNTSSYTVSSIPYSPPYQFTCMRNPVSVNIDDKWSPIVNLPFNFCFYGNTYNQCLIGSNGVITFDTIGNIPGGTCGWSFNTDSANASNIPVAGHSSLVENSIFGVFQDIDPGDGGEVGWELITLNTGCRALVASWSNVPMYDADSANDYTGMMVLYENTNIIEVYIQKKRITTHTNFSGGIWNDGNAVVGIQNATGTIATVAPGRNGLDPNWTATNEAWRFTPNGANVPTSVTWYEGAGTTGPVVGTGSTISVCPTTTTTYTAEVTYTLCNGLTHRLTAQTPVTVSTDKTWNGSVSTNWAVANNWTPPGIPLATHSVTIPNVANDPIVSSNVVACSVAVQNGGILTINSNSNITVTNAVNVNTGGQFIVQDDASLVQVNNVTNSGNIEYRRTSNLRLLDYCYWSSPVANFPVQSVSPATSPGFIFKWGPTTANPNGGQGYWINTSENMQAATGYILRAPNGFPAAVATPYTANFIGVPNNGNISIPINRGTNFTGIGTQGIPRTIRDDNWNLIGNPYPSAIGVNEFLTANATAASNDITGAVRIWMHGQLPTNTTDPFYQNFALNYFSSDYLLVNLTGATSGPGNYKIGGGQGFFVEMDPGAAGAGTVNFTNGMRSASFANNQFYKNVISKENSRIWLDFFSPNRSVNRVLVGYVAGATDGKDDLYDAQSDTKAAINFYSLVDENTLSIQGKKTPFHIYDKIPLGFKTDKAGECKISIAFRDGIFENGEQNIYLEDKLLNVLHDLRNSVYTFNTNAGKFEDRFVLRYTDKNIEDVTSDNGIQIFTNSTINVITNGKNIKDIVIYDVLGKTIWKKTNINNTTYVISDIISTNRILLVNVTTVDNSVITKKVVF